MLALLALALQIAHLEIGKKTLLVEIADSQEARNRGLSSRRELPEGQGMLFVFERPTTLFFWMKDTQIPLSIGFFDAEQVLLQTEHLHPGSLSIVPSHLPAQYALEVPQGWFEKHGIRLGEKFSFRKISSQVK